MVSHKIRGSVHDERFWIIRPSWCCIARSWKLICMRGKFDGCEGIMRFGNIEGREGEPCRVINFRSRSCYTLDLASHHDDTRSMRFCAYYYVVTTNQPVGGEKRRYPRIRETKGSRSWIRKCVVSNFAFSSSRILWRTLVLQSRGNLIIGRHFTSAAA